MEIIIELLIIQALLVFVIDYSGAVDEMFTPLVKKITGAKIGHLGKPWSCSTCQTWWIGLIWIAIRGCFNLPYIGLVALLAALTPVTLDVLWLVRDFLQMVIHWLRWITGLDR